MVTTAQALDRLTASPDGSVHPLDRLRYHVTGAIQRGEKEAIVEVTVTNKQKFMDALISKQRLETED